VPGDTSVSVRGVIPLYPSSKYTSAPDGEDDIERMLVVGDGGEETNDADTWDVSPAVTSTPISQWS